uniref:Uncharacterized protein n=1 Tax=Periophthalmus magnuspinnatus TaxID=409849 RepID=A0A3B4AJF9_9GOBI
SRMKLFYEEHYKETGKCFFLPGPDGVGDYRPRLCDFPQYIGEGGGSSEATGDLGYLWRAAPHTLPHRSRDSYVGGVGWGWYYNQSLNQDALLSNMQIKVQLYCALCRYSRSQTGWRDYVSRLAWEHFGVPHRQSWRTCLG